MDGGNRGGRGGVARHALRGLTGGVVMILAMAPAVLGQSGALAQADQPAVTIAYPSDGQIVTDNAVAVVPQFKNWNLRCDLAGTPNVPGAGHYHLEVDGALVNMFCNASVVSFKNLKTAFHTITVLPAKNDH